MAKKINKSKLDYLMNNREAKKTYIIENPNATEKPYEPQTTSEPERTYNSRSLSRPESSGEPKFPSGSESLCETENQSVSETERPGWYPDTDTVKADASKKPKKTIDLFPNFNKIG